MGTDGDEAASPPDDSTDVVALRGAGVDVDARRFGRLLVLLGVIGLGILVIALFVAAAQRNHQISELRDGGVPVKVTVTTCRGLMGGSGSNAAGNVCTGTYVVDGRSYHVVIPGNTLFTAGTVLKGVTAANDPSVFSTQSIVNGEKPSARVYVLPTVLLVLELVLIVLVVRSWRRRRDQARSPQASG